MLILLIRSSHLLRGDENKSGHTNELNEANHFAEMCERFPPFNSLAIYVF